MRSGRRYVGHVVLMFINVSVGMGRSPSWEHGMFCTAQRLHVTMAVFYGLDRGVSLIYLFIYVFLPAPCSGTLLVARSNLARQLDR